MNIDDLRTTLYATIQDVRDGKLDSRKAKEIAAIGQVIVNSAKAEVEFLRAKPNATGSGFIPERFIAGTRDKPRMISGAAMSGSK